MYYCVQLSVLQNIYWKELALLLFVWISFLGIQIVKVKKPLPLITISSLVSKKHNEISDNLIAADIHSHMLHQILDSEPLAGKIVKKKENIFAYVYIYHSNKQVS